MSTTPTIKIAVSEADATLVHGVTLTAGMVALPVVRFTFDSAWDGLGKTAVVRAGAVALEVLVVNNEITVPAEALETAGVNLIIGVYGADETVAIPTVWCACGEILTGATLEEGTNTGEATTTLVDQMLAYAEDIQEIAENLDELAIRTVTVNTTGANQYGIASVTLSDTGSGENRTITFAFSNLKGNGIESVAFSTAGEYRGRLQITESDTTVTTFDGIKTALDTLDNLNELSEAYAKGTVNGTPVASGEPGYHDNSKYYAEQAATSATTASSSAASAMGYASSASGSKTAAQTAQGKAEDAQAAAAASAAEASGYAESASDDADTASDAAETAGSYSTAANTNALVAEGYAAGTQGGVAVQSGTYYHNNAKYYKEQADADATSASNSASSASSDASSANTNALKAEGYAVGKQNGTDVSSGTYYHDNAKYYKEQAASSATAAGTDALKAEGFAVGKQDGTDVGSSSPYYHNNAAYYAEQAGDSASDAADSAAAAEEYLGYAESYIVGTTLFLNKCTISGTTLYI